LCQTLVIGGATRHYPKGADRVMGFSDEGIDILGNDTTKSVVVEAR